MFKKTKTITATAPADDRPGFEIPEELAEFYPTGYMQARGQGGNPADDILFPNSVRRHMTAVAVREISPDGTLDSLSKSETARLDARVQELEASVLHDPITSLEFYFHLRALAIAVSLASDAKDSEEREAQYRKRSTCPVCGHCEPAENGPVQSRDLKGDGETSRYRRMFKSCRRCFEVAKAQYAAHIAGQPTTDGTRSRAEAVWDALALN